MSAPIAAGISLNVFRSAANATGNADTATKLTGDLRLNAAKTQLELHTTSGVIALHNEDVAKAFGISHTDLNHEFVSEAGLARIVANLDKLAATPIKE